MADMILENIDDLADQRGLLPSTLYDAGFFVADSGEYTGWFGIPYPNLVGEWKVRYRNPDTGVEKRHRYRDPRDAPAHLYNPLVLGPNEPEVWFAEGEFDTLTLVELGLPAIGIHGVKNVREDEETGELDERSRFKKAWRLLFEDSRVVVAFDNDEEGQKAGRRLARGLDGEVFDEWEDYDDLNDWYSADPEGLRSAVRRYRRRMGWRDRLV